MKTSTIFLIVCVSIIFNSISFGQTTSTILSSTNLGNKDKLISPERFIINNNEVFIELEYQIENIFYIIPYSLIGSLFLSFFYKDSFSLYINGNGGFVGNYLNQTFLSKAININTTISYYLLIILVMIFFILSINFSAKYLYLLVNKIFNKNNNITINVKVKK